MPVKVVHLYQGTRQRVTMKKEREVSARHFTVDTVGINKMNRYIEAKERKGWNLKW